MMQYFVPVATIRRKWNCFIQIYHVIRLRYAYSGHAHTICPRYAEYHISALQPLGAAHEDSRMLTTYSLSVPSSSSLTRAHR